MPKMLTSGGNQESIIPELAELTGERKHPASEVYQLKRVFAKIEEKGKHPMSESYELKPINVPTFSNLERGGTSESKIEKEDDYDYNHDLAILKAIYHYYFNHGAIPHPPYSKNFIDYIEDSVPNVKFRGQALANKIIMFEHHFLKVMKMAARIGYYPEIIHPIYRKIFNLSMDICG
ncbi:hypothetical protein CQW23_32797 [Capsicum baccatum]|uniref:Uncharacterized protein n=1 Tax=Capsicum baccatum TaxID=33114 RepID=A0A2G2V3R5_CAPBA|nr:hypothetical protein CQW23_32797 [Capsicum baccatum]